MRRVRGSEAGTFAQVTDSGHRLLALLASHVDKHLLEQIAASDDAVEQTRHLVALVKIWKTGTIVAPLQKYPRDVLDIVRGGKLGNLASAFSCAVLLSDACSGDGAGAPFAFADVTAQLILSLKELPFDANDAAQELLESLPTTSLTAAECVLLESGILWFALRNEAGGVARAMVRIAGVVRGHFEAMSSNWGLVAEELALPDMTVLDMNRGPWLQIAELMCDMDFGQLDRSLAGKVGVHVELLRRGLT